MSTRYKDPSTGNLTQTRKAGKLLMFQKINTPAKSVHMKNQKSNKIKISKHKKSEQ